MKRRNKNKEILSDSDKLKKINSAIDLAEKWIGEQDISEHQICMACLKDIRRIARS